MAIFFLFFGLLCVSRALPQEGVHASENVRIIGGTNSEQGEMPYQILLMYNGKFLCGGSLVIIKEQQVVVTAAHCVTRGTASDYTVVAGGHNRFDLSGFEQIRQVSRGIRHAGFSARSMGGGGTAPNDIAILFPETPFELNDRVAPIPLPTPGQDTTGQVISSGWGKTTPGKNGNLPGILQKVQTEVVDNAACRRAYSRVFLSVIPSQLCSGERGRDVCNGDSGGPVVSVDDGYLAGIVSWSLGCAKGGFPGVSTRVSHYIDWLNAMV